MKRLAFACLLISFSSCSPSPTGSSEQNKKLIVGMWLMVHPIAEGKVYWDFDAHGNLDLYWWPTHLGLSPCYGGPGKYEFTDGGKLKLSFPRSATNPQIYSIVSLSPKELILRQDDYEKVMKEEWGKREARWGKLPTSARPSIFGTPKEGDLTKFMRMDSSLFGTLRDSVRKMRLPTPKSDSTQTASPRG